MKFMYDLTVLIPIYNAEKTLSETVESVLNQKINGDLSFEILLINDGSADESKAICEKYEDNYENIKYFSHENRGVSYTRNRGMNLASGKYILFLDGDDLIHETTLEENYKIFEENEKEADILAYPIYKYNGSKALKHPRTFLYKDTMVCDVEEFPHLNQTSMNVMIKNVEDKVYFNESMPFAEDTFFNIDMIMRTGKIIISSKGKYLYRTNSFSTVNLFKSPVRTANYLVDSYLTLINKYKKENKIPKYIQSVMLYELNWRMKFNALFPKHFNEEQYQKWEEKYLEILNYMETDVLLSQKNMDKFHKYYFLRSKVNNEKMEIDVNSERIQFKYDHEEILEIEEFLLVFTKFHIKNNMLIMSGFIKEPLLEYLKDKIELYINIDGEKKLLNLYKSNFGHYKTKEYTNLFLQFDCELPLKNQEIKFEAHLNHYVFPTRFYFKENTMIKDNFFKEKRVIFGNYLINTKNGIININDSGTPLRYLRKTVEQGLIYKKMMKTKYAALVPFTYLKKKSKEKVNLYSDRNGVYSEAYQLFKKNLKNIKDESHYYVYRKAGGINKLKRINENERKYFVEYGSIQHKSLFLSANKVYTSSTVFGNYSAFGAKSYNFIAEHVNFELIWLKGFMNNGYYPKKYAREITGVDKVIVKSKKDKENLIKQYNFNEEQIEIDSSETNKKQGEKRILISFTWRSYLFEKKFKNQEEKKKGRFAQSPYFNHLMQILESKELSDMMREGYQVDLYLHPKFQRYQDLFNLINLNINVLFRLESLNEYDLLISDYSSLIDAFEINGKKVLKYHIDYEEFVCGNHIFKELISYENYLFTLEELFLELTKIRGEKNEEKSKGSN